jgi:hypothetical protein
VNLWQSFLRLKIVTVYGLSPTETAILLAKFPDENTAKTNKEVADGAFAEENNDIPINPETVQKQMWTIYNERFCPKEKREGFLGYNDRSSPAKDTAFLAWLKPKYLNWRSSQRSAFSTGDRTPAISCNPFIPQTGKVDDPQLFFGREGEIKRVFEVLNSNVSVVLIGEEGIGKSSLLSAICQQAENLLLSARKPIYLDLNGVRDEDDFYTALCQQVGIPKSEGYMLTRALKKHRVLLAIENVGKMTWDGFTRGVRDHLRGLAEGQNAPLQLIVAASEPLDQLFNDSQDEVKTAPFAGIFQLVQESGGHLASEQRQDSLAEPLRNPYVVGDPVQGKLFVGRKDIIRKLEELWVTKGNQLQSVVLYGHRRMGKTSILLNVANSLGSQVKVAYVNLLLVGDSSQGVGEVLMAISDEISEAVNIPPPADADLLNLPYPTFRRYLKQVEANLSETGLIIALDEFEKIEKLIEKGKIDSDFMEVLGGMVQMSHKIAFALAGLHTLGEMTGDCSHPFFGSFINIKVSFMESAATRQILANPHEDFLLDYAPEALSAISSWTTGQPYLVQLVGFQLVRRYNQQVFEMGNSRDPVFTVEDVRAVINDPEFFQRGDYYFDGVWDQATRGAPGQQEILRAIAPHPEGLDINTLAEITGMNETNLQPALNSLIRHDVVWEIDGKWRIIVELLRVWVDKCI